MRMARRASFFERIFDDYSSDSATGSRSDRTTPRLATAIETPTGVDDSRIVDEVLSTREVLRRADFDDDYASDASYVTVDDEFDATSDGAARDKYAVVHREALSQNASDRRGADKKYDGDDLDRGVYHAGASGSRNNRNRSGP